MGTNGSDISSISSPQTLPTSLITSSTSSLFQSTISVSPASLIVTTPPTPVANNVYSLSRAIVGDPPGDEMSNEAALFYDAYLKPYYQEYLQFEVVILSLLLIFGSITNGLALCHISFRSQIKSGSNILLLNLIVVDFAVLFFVIAPQIAWCKAISWEIGSFFCKLHQTLKYFSLFASSFMVVCISYNRYYLLKEPHIFQKEKQRAYRMLKITYISAIILSIPQAIIYDVVTNPTHNFQQCVGFIFFTAEWELRAYNFYSLLGMYLIPLKLIILLYSKIIASLNLDKYVVARMSKSASSEERLSQKTNCMLKTKRKAISTFLAVTISFIVCWTPYAFIVLWQIFSGQEEIINPIVTSLMYIIALALPILNPMVNSFHAYTFLFVWKRSGSTSQLVNRLVPLRGRSNTSDLKPINCSNDKAYIMK